MITIPDFLTFLANNTIIALLALVAWIFVVAAVVWLGEKAVKKFRQRLSRTATQADASVSSVATLEQASAGEQASARRKPGMEPEAAE
jgi:ascorbate-specific PTS system EIIC-type component UlaA